MSDYIYLVAPLTAWAVSQIIKLVLDKVNSGKLRFWDLLSSGSMPSAHVSGPVAFLTVFGSRQGYDDPLFALGFMFAVLVAYDSFGVRRTAAETAASLKKISRKLNIDPKPLHIYRGHTPIEVAGGALLGFAIGLLCLRLM